MSSVWIVTSESGYYSMYESHVEGVFASYEGAVAYVESQHVTAYHHVGTMTNYDGWTKPHDEWSTSSEPKRESCTDTADTKVVETVELTPVKDEGTTFVYRYPNGNRLDEWADTYIISEYEVIK